LYNRAGETRSMGEKYPKIPKINPDFESA